MSTKAIFLSLVLGGLALGLVSTVSACGGNKPSTFDNGTDAAPNDDGSGDEYVEPILPPSDAGEGGGNVTHCSADLHSILNEQNQVLMTCPADQGCGAGGCVPACDSAAQNKSSIGCDYYSYELDALGGYHGGCFAAYIANTWGVPITLTADYNGQKLSMANMARIPSGKGNAITYNPLPGGMLPAGQIAILFLAQSSSIACPQGVAPGLSTDGATTGTGIGHAFHISSTAPVAAYDIYPFGGSTSFIASATLLLPTTAWGDNYVVVAPFFKDVAVSSAQQSTSIVASADGTTVTINPINPIVAGNGVAGTGKNVPHTYSLKKGEVLQFTQDDELTGSAIQSNKPVGLWGSATCFNIDVSDVYCDAAHQQIPPVSALGHEYVAVRYRNRNKANPEEIVPWRVVGAVNGTNLTYFPKAPKNAPTTTGFGKLTAFWDTGPFVIQSQDDMHPFYISAHITGQDYAPVSGTGDPEFVNIIPPQEFLPSYVFFTDVTYANTNLVLVRKDTGSGYSDVNLDCLGVVKGWKPINGTTYQYTTVDISVDSMAQGKCDNGLHTIKSDAPFGLTVWGWDQYCSYAYPAGASVQPINTVVVPAVPH